MVQSVLDGTSREPAAPTTVRSVMSRPAVAVTPDTDFSTMVAALTATRRGILPVVAPDGTVAGVVAASDLLAAYAAPDQGPPSILAGALMTAPAVSVTQDQGIVQALAVLDRASLHHLPVVDDQGRLVGLLGPHDLLEALRREDDALRDQALAVALAPGSGVAPGALRVDCERGRLVLAGRTRTRSDAAALCLAVAGIEGLVGLVDRLRWETDDTAVASTEDQEVRDEAPSGH
ncbi:CBS domain-containing protein [Kitasatospora sp. NPDC058965]|uniref:CBS domain-containing protein n=1 Tax=Kitasatospora sp. NPDC058965 TaxID=3346682 RepID=UPI0036A11A50